MNTTPEKSFSVVMTVEQAQAILQLVDLAVKSQGLVVAAAALAVHKLITEAHQAAQ